MATRPCRRPCFLSLYLLILFLPLVFLAGDLPAASQVSPARPGAAPQGDPRPLGPAQLAASPAPLGAAPQGHFGESLDVDVVSIEVFVTDHDGRPVQNLHRDDFSVLEDGKPVPVAYFYASGHPAPAAPMSQAAGTGTPTPGVAAPPPLPRDHGLDIAVLMDMQNTTPAKMNSMIDSLRDFLGSHLRPGDRVTLASLTGSVHILLAPTANREALRARLDQIAARAARGLGRVQDLDDLATQEANIGRELHGAGGHAQQVPQSTIVDEIESVAAEVDSYTNRKIAETESAVDALATFVDALAALPGRKALLYVSGGFSLRPGEVVGAGVRAALDRPMQEGLRSTRPGLLQELVARANSSRVTLYTIWTPDEAGLETAERLNREEPMLTLALDTGGMEAHDPLRPVRFLDALQDDFASFYSLGFTPAGPRDAKSHKVEVRTRDRSLKLRYRTSYRARSGAERVRDRTVAALLLGTADNPLNMELTVGKESRDEKGQVKLPVTVKLPLAQLGLLPRDGFHQGQLTFYFGARGLSGWTSPMTRIEVPFRIPDTRLATQADRFAAYTTSILLRPEETILAVGVRDDIAQADSVLNTIYRPAVSNASTTSPPVAAAPAAKPR